MSKLARTELHRTWIHRARFLSILVQEAPEAIEDFRVTVIGGMIEGFRAIHYLHFQPFLDYFRSPDRLRDEWQRDDLPHPAHATLDFMQVCKNAFAPAEDDSSDIADAKREVADAIQNWLRRWTLVVPWMRDVAISNGYWCFMQWLRTGQMEAPSALDVPESTKQEMLTIEMEGGELITHRHAYPAFDFRVPPAFAQLLHLDVDVLEQMLSQWLDQAKQQYVEEVQAANKKNGIVQLPSTTSEAEHFRWLARYQVFTESYAEVAKKCGAKEATVKKTVPSMSKLIDLPLRRPKKAGRPKGS